VYGSVRCDGQNGQPQCHWKYENDVARFKRYAHIMGWENQNYYDIAG